MGDGMEMIRNTARDVAEKLTPTTDAPAVLDEDKEAALTAKAFHMMIEAARKWCAEHGPSEHCSIQVTRDENDVLTVKVTPMEDADGK